MNELVLLTVVIGAHEGQEVITADIPGAFLQGEQDEVIHMVLHGKLAKLLINCDPALYAPFSQCEQGELVQYVQLMKGLYGCLQAAIQFWKKLSAQLVEWGSTINPYGCCVMNKMVGGDQLTIMWHVDNLKMSHVSSKVLDNLLGQLNLVFRQEVPLTVNKTKKHDYLGITLDYSHRGKVIIDMEQYIKGVLAEAPSDMSWVANTPASAHLFQPFSTKIVPTISRTVSPPSGYVAVFMQMGSP